VTTRAWIDESGEVRLRGTIVPEPGGPSSVSVPVTAAQLKDLAANPVTLIAAPGSNMVVLPLSALIHLTFNTVAYTTVNSAPVITWGNDVAPAFATPNLAFWSAAQSSVWAGIAAVANQAFTDAVLVDAPIMLAQDDQDLAAGNSPVLVTVTYSIIDLT
jgi:hypothetical protein